MDDVMPTMKRFNCWDETTYFFNQQPLLHLFNYKSLHALPLKR